jgi:NADPH-dependent ferric siderophore reductase
MPAPAPPPTVADYRAARKNISGTSVCRFPTTESQKRRSDWLEALVARAPARSTPKAAWSPVWLHHTSEVRHEEPSSLISEIMKFEPPFGDGFIWIAADASIARSLRDFFLRHRGHPKV